MPPEVFPAVLPCPLFLSAVTAIDRVTAAVAMAELTPAGLLVALLFFLVLTMRDIQLGGSSADLMPDSEPGRATKASLYTGPVLRFQYW